MMGLVPFEFKNLQAASNAETALRRDAEREVTTPAFDTKTKRRRCFGLKLMPCTKNPANQSRGRTTTECLPVWFRYGLQRALDCVQVPRRHSCRRDCSRSRCRLPIGSVISAVRL